MARTLVNLNTEGIPIRLINLSSEPREIQRGQTLGEIVPIKEVIEFGMEEKYTNTSFSEYHRICRIHQSNLPDQGLVPQMTSRGHIRLPTIPTEFYSEAVNLNRIEMDQPLQQNGMEETCNLSGNVRIIAENPNIPPHLLQLFNESLENLSKWYKIETLRKLLEKHEATFAKNKMDLGKCSILKHKISFHNTGFAAPIRQQIRRKPKGFEHEEEQYLKDQLESGVVVPPSSAWSSPVCLVRKKDGSVRWCIDYRKLNDVTVKDAYPLPRIDSCLDCLASTKLFSTLDL